MIAVDKIPHQNYTLHFLVSAFIGSTVLDIIMSPNFDPPERYRSSQGPSYIQHGSDMLEDELSKSQARINARLESIAEEFENDVQREQEQHEKSRSIIIAGVRVHGSEAEASALESEDRFKSVFPYSWETVTVSNLYMSWKVRKPQQPNGAPIVARPDPAAAPMSVTFPEPQPIQIDEDLEMRSGSGLEYQKDRSPMAPASIAKSNASSDMPLASRSVDRDLEPDPLDASSHHNRNSISFKSVSRGTSKSTRSSLSSAPSTIEPVPESMGYGSSPFNPAPGPVPGSPDNPHQLAPSSTGQRQTKKTRSKVKPPAWVNRRQSRRISKLAPQSKKKKKNNSAGGVGLPVGPRTKAREPSKSIIGPHPSPIREEAIEASSGFAPFTGSSFSFSPARAPTTDKEMPGLTPAAREDAYVPDPDDFSDDAGPPQAPVPASPEEQQGPLTNTIPGTPARTCHIGGVTGQHFAFPFPFDSEHIYIVRCSDCSVKFSEHPLLHSRAIDHFKSEHGIIMDSNEQVMDRYGVLGMSRQADGGRKSVAQKLILNSSRKTWSLLGHLC